MLIQNLPRCGPPPSGQHRMRRVVGHHRWICPAGATPLNSACEVASAWGALPLATWQFKATGAPDVGTSIHWPWQATPTPPLVVQRVVRQREGSHHSMLDRPSQLWHCRNPMGLPCRQVKEQQAL